uniref:hypothetical protein n=1 Tax=Eisenbergiella tayi TaxID=1432052 RepID=UPI003FD7F8D7
WPVRRPCRPPCAALFCKVPCRGRFRSDNHATVLRLRRTQPKDRRDYDAPYRNPYRTAPRRVDGRDGGQAKAGRGIPGAAGRAQKGCEL